MGKRTLKNLLSFLLVLVLTVGVVAVLSASTKAESNAAVRYLQEIHQESTQAEAFFAPARERGTVSIVEATGGFLLILAVVGAGLLVLARGKRRGRQPAVQCYEPKKDMTWNNSARASSVRYTRKAAARKKKPQRRARNTPSTASYPVRRRV